MAESKLGDFINKHKKRILNGKLNIDRERRAGHRIIHYIHIGKTAGTALKSSFTQYNDLGKRRYFFVTHAHGVKLADIPDNDCFLFSIRDPVQRFYSGFYSRKRKGQPRLYVEWSAAEEIAFNRFDHALDLAEALDDKNLEARFAAITAMNSIKHVRASYFLWFPDISLLSPANNRLVAVLRQEELQQDFSAMAAKLDFPASITLPHGNSKAHRNDYSRTPKLSSRAVRNLNKWYARDYLFHASMLNLIEAMNGVSR